MEMKFVLIATKVQPGSDLCKLNIIQFNQHLTHSSTFAAMTKSLDFENMEVHAVAAGFCSDGEYYGKSESLHLACPDDITGIVAMLDYDSFRTMDEVQEIQARAKDLFGA